MTDLEQAASAYAAARRAHETAADKAKAASARYTAERTTAAKEAMGAAWSKADKAMRAMHGALDRLGEAAVAHEAGQ